MKRIAFWLLILSFFGCMSTKTQTNTDVDTKALDDLIAEGSFEIRAEFAQPMANNSLLQISNAGLLPPGSTAGNISLIGNANFLQIHGDTVKAYLPFYGERRMGGSYGEIRTGIEFNGLPENYEVKKGKKSGYEISFNIKDKNSRTENYNVNIYLFPNLTSTINIRSSHRFNIRYKGNIKLLEVE